MRKLTPLATISAFNQTIRDALVPYWITTAEEFVTVAKGSNKKNGSGLAALATVLSMPQAKVRELFDVAQKVFPPDSAFAAETELELEVGGGAIFDDLQLPEASAFDLPLELPAEVILNKKLPPPAQQGKRDSCVAFSLIALYQQATGDSTDLSEQFLFWKCKEMDGIPNVSATKPDVAFAILRDVGVCSEKTWPYRADVIPGNFGQGPPPAGAIEEAKKRRIVGFKSLEAKNVRQLQAVLASGKAILIGLSIREHWVTTGQARTLGRLRRALPGEDNRGGHAMCLVGYRDEAGVPGGGYFLVRNSWGTTWAAENPDGAGYAHIPYSLINEECIIACVIDSMVSKTQLKAAKLGGAAEETQKEVEAKEEIVEKSQEPFDSQRVYSSLQIIQDQIMALSNQLNQFQTQIVPKPALPNPVLAEQTPATQLLNSTCRVLDSVSLLLNSVSQNINLRQPVPKLTDRILKAAQRVKDAEVQAQSPASPAQISTSEAQSPEAQAQSPVSEVQSSVSEAQSSSKPLPRASIMGPITLLAGKSADSNLQLIANGIDALTGKPLLQLDAAAATQMAQATPDSSYLRDLHKTKCLQNKKHLGTIFGVSEDKLAESRWAVVVNSDDDAALLKALSPLIEFRSQQQGSKVPKLTFQDGENCGAWLQRNVPEGAAWANRPPVLVYNPGESCTQWLTRHRVSQGPVDPSRGVPFYLMLAGRPGPLKEGDTAFIPFSFQYELDLFWGVGRLCFNDASGQHTYAAYQSYAEQLVAFETGTAALAKQAVFFATRHDMDRATERSADELVKPLVEGHDNLPGIVLKNGFTQTVFSGKEASRANLARILQGQSGGGTPALFFSATHGIGLPASDERLVMQQGALLCQDWTGIGGIKRDHWFAGEDVTAQTNLAGMVAICFACYGCGCPQEDEFIFVTNEENQTISRPSIAPHPLIAQLPQQLLLRGALAVLGHVDRAWTYSFSGPNVPAQSQAFEDVLARLLAGKRLGFVTDQFNLRQGALSSLLANEIENVSCGKQAVPANLGPLWVARNDARNYCLLGDPAVRLPVEKMVGSNGKTP